ncbi:hypothetical protein IQ260_03895 [Leptolyngbya cf. ectocarpi LEGE 11479]|uniref:Uncharacterized protein n=1 Tax=Leptolyngbya cf. ectocarpi LEGE 11479 TaxID=1828722 RepID=A0A928X1R6_LEPEC|nr:hypothetical protein [Leptolyngbya ectocarpi]MBE9065791.1 hypothetical protein [Leptolyngbya cf. ectocarpi LEGE 11479]
MGLSKSRPATTHVKLLVSPPSGRVPWSLLSWLALGSGAALLIAVIVSGARLIVDPYSPNWLKRAFPSLVNSFEAAPQTAADIRAELRSQNLVAGQPLPWPQIDQPKAWFYPILSSDGRAIQELWVYRVRGDLLQRVEQVAIAPMKDSFITTPLVGTASQVASVDSDAPLSSVKLMPGAANPWILLTGQRRYGNTTMAYGQILSYQPHSQRLHRLLNWSSSVGQPPQWRHNKTGETSETKDSQLVVDQTVGLRPSFLLYQLVPNDPPQLKEVSLYRSVYTSNLSTSLYDKALQLAQGAVWSHSLQMMQSAKKALAKDWSPEAQRQLDLIRLHAEKTKAQTAQTWSSQEQHILTYLIDGQWDQALSALEATPAIYESTLKRLERDFDALWRGVTVHLKVHPQDVTTQIWGALLVSARQSAEAGEDWLKQKTRSKQALERLRAVGRSPVIAAVTSADSSPASAAGDQVSTAADSLPTTTGVGRYVGLVGQASVTTTPDKSWLRSQTLPTPVTGQTWYQIEVQLLQDSSGWGRPPASMTGANFWAESQGLRRQMQLFRDSQPVAGVTVHGVKATNASLSLLAIGPDISGPALVATSNSLQWLTTLPWQPAPPVNGVSAGSEATAAPGPDALMAATMGHHLGLAPEQTSQLYPYLQHTTSDLSGDASPEHLFTIGRGIPPEFNLTPGKTMIFSTAGDLLYSDIGQQQSLLALTNKDTEHPATLLVEQAGRYSVVGF